VAELNSKALTTKDTKYHKGKANDVLRGSRFPLSGQHRILRAKVFQAQWLAERARDRLSR
jgi:hypothetical protein